jgi:SAM-dependent methyltransferase
LEKLKPEEDTFGQEMWAYYKGKEVFEVVERNDGYIDPSALTPKMYFLEYDDWTPFEKKAITFVKGKVLDIGCGVGRHSLYLQKKGFDVLGIDNSPLAVKISKLRGLKKAEIIPIEEVDFPSKSFDTIIMMGNNFGLFGSYRKAQRLLKKFHKMTTKQALIIANTRDPYNTENPIHLEYHKLNKEKGRMGGQVTIRVRYGKDIGRWFDYLMVSKDELKEVLASTGWKVSQFIDSDNSEYVAIIQKV